MPMVCEPLDGRGDVLEMIAISYALSLGERPGEPRIPPAPLLGDKGEALDPTHGPAARKLGS